MDTTKPEVGTPEITISSPHDVNPSRIGMLIDLTVSAPVTNIRKDELSVEISDATITVLMDKKIKTIRGAGNSITIPPQQVGTLKITFRDVPVQYELQSNPLRLTPLISEYGVRVKYKGTVKLFFGLISYNKEDEYSKIVPTSEIPIDKNLFSSFLKT